MSADESHCCSASITGLTQSISVEQTIARSSLQKPTQRSPFASNMSSLFSFLSYFGQSSSESSTPAPALSPGQQQNLMFEAVEKDDREAVERLLRERPSLANATTEKGESVLEVAMLKNRCAIAQLLIRSGANVNAKRADGTSPLELFITRRPPRGHTAVSENRCQTLNVLLEAGANVHHCTRQGATALHIAAERNLLPFAEALLKAGADVNKLDSFSQTPLATLLIYLGDNNRRCCSALLLLAFAHSSLS